MNKNLIFIYAPKTSARLQYIAYVLFDQLLGIDFQIITDRQDYINCAFPKVNYCNQSITANEIQIANCGLLFEKKIQPPALNPSIFRELPTLFHVLPKDTSATFPFDFFSMAFFLLSRYEEYLPHTSDQHGRFAAKVSVAHHYQFLQLPIIELWLFQLRNVLQQKFPTLIISPSLFKFSPTYDIDLAWAYLNRPWWRTVGSWMKNILTGEWQLASEQQNVLRGKMTDPYDTFAFLGQLQRQFHLQPIFFFLLADYGKYDKNIHPQNTALQSLIKTLHKQYQIGIHPSYQSNSSFQILTKEVRQLEQIIQRPIQHSRQHFLKLHLPDTYQNLLELNVIHDYSMGYADEIGFRAGISRPYFWYDLRKEEMTKLTIHPFCVMDVTLQQYLQLSPSTAVENVKRLIRTLQTVGGTFSTLWHNSSFSDTHGWVEWQNAYQQIVALASNQIIK